MEATKDEILGVPVAVWTLLATLLLAGITAVYVVLTYRIAKGAEGAAQAARASLNIEMDAAYYGPEDLFGIVQVKNLGATLYLHAATVTAFWGEEALADLDEPLGRVETWGEPPWLMHKGEHRTFYWPSRLPRPGPETILVTIAVDYSIGLAGERATVSVPLEVRSSEES